MRFIVSGLWRLQPDSFMFREPMTDGLKEKWHGNRPLSTWQARCGWNASRFSRLPGSHKREKKKRKKCKLQFVYRRSMQEFFRTRLNVSVRSRLNSNLSKKKMAFAERERSEYLEKNLSEQRWETTTNWYGVDSGIGTRVTSVKGECGSHHCATVVLRNPVLRLPLNNPKFNN